MTAKTPGARARVSFRNPIAGPGRGRFSIEGEARQDREERHSEEMREVLYTIARDANAPEMVRLHAADKMLDRIEGRPIARDANSDAKELRVVIEGGLPRNRNADNRLP